ncbi:MAG: helix-turn-helix domain-containing protein [Planctomycetota bacterium]
MSSFPPADLLVDRETFATCDTPAGVGVLGCFSDADPRSGHSSPHRVRCRLGHYGLNYVIAGGGTYVDEHGRSIRMGPGDCFQRLPRVEHSTLIDGPGYGEVSLGLDPPLMEHLVALGLIAPDRRVWHIGRRPDLLQRFHRLMDRMQRLGRDTPQRELLLGCLHLLGACAPGPHPSTDPLQEAADAMQADPGLDPRTAADIAGMGYHSFRRAFRRRFGEAPGAWLLRQRMHQACRLLGDRLVKQVATELGYADASVFARQFHRSIGMWPRDYQRMQAGSERV